MVQEHDPAYRACLEAAKRDYHALLPEVRKLQYTVNALRNVIHALSSLLEEDISREFQYESEKMYNRAGGARGRSSLRGRPAGGSQGKTHYDND